MTAISVPLTPTLAKFIEETTKKGVLGSYILTNHFAHKTLTVHRLDILTYFDFDGLSTGSLEGTNNRIKTLHKIAYGFKDIEFIKLKIMALHESSYVLVD